MKNLKIYDNGGETCDRYTVVFTDRPECIRNPYNRSARRSYACLAMSEKPFHPHGFGQHSTAMLGRHLGKSIKFEDLPVDCQKMVLQNL